MIESLLSSIFTDLPSILGSGAICGAIGWFFGGKQANKNTIDNDSHQREKDFFEIVDSRTEREVKKTIKKVTCSSYSKKGATYTYNKTAYKLKIFEDRYTEYAKQLKVLLKQFMN